MTTYTREIGDEQGLPCWRASVSYTDYHKKQVVVYKVENFKVGYSQGEALHRWYDGYNVRHHSKFYFTYLTTERDQIDDVTEQVLLEQLRHSLEMDNRHRLMRIEETRSYENERMDQNKAVLNSAVYRADKIDRLDFL